MKAEQRDGVEYEFTTVLDIIHDGHAAIATKDRTGLFADADPKPITPETGKQLLNWLESGEVVDRPEPPAAGIQESAVTDHLTAINDAATTDELKAAYGAAVKAAKAANDDDAHGQFCTAKDTRKAALSEPTAA